MIFYFSLFSIIWFYKWVNKKILKKNMIFKKDKSKLINYNKNILIWFLWFFNKKKIVRLKIKDYFSIIIIYRMAVKKDS